jgi:rfaE bifunctional protein nucleotidyltransferase chain/domain
MKAISRVIARSKLPLLIRRLRRERRRIVFTNGVFDILHRGHVDYLASARSFGDVLIVGLNSDASVRRIKGPDRPIQNQRDRAIILSSLRPVDYVVIFSEETPEKLIMTIRPDVLVKGADWAIEDIVGATFVQSYGGKVRRVRMRQGRSSTSLIQLLRSRLED